MLYVITIFHEDVSVVNLAVWRPFNQPCIWAVLIVQIKALEGASPGWTFVVLADTFSKKFERDG